MTINDLAFEMVKDKDDKNAIKKLEKKIKSWENEKAYPTLDDIYQMAYIIEINPGELLAIRNRGRKQFYKESDEPPSKKHHWLEIDDDVVLVLIGFARLFGIFALFVFGIVLFKFVDTYFGSTGSIVEQEVIVRQIQNATDPENMTEYNTVQEMVKDVRRNGSVSDMGF